MEYQKTAQNTVKRGRHKARYDKPTIHAILDAAEICHVAFSVEGKAMVQPINFGRDGEQLFLHGAPGNRMTSALIEAGEVCLSVTLLDGLKLTKSAYHHSVNFRSAVIFGEVVEVKTDEAKREALKTIINHVVPDRWEHCRAPNEKELQATRVIKITISSASAKVVNTPPFDEPEDLNLEYWAGEIPVRQVYENPISRDDSSDPREVPAHVLAFIQNKAEPPSMA